MFSPHLQLPASVCVCVTAVCHVCDMILHGKCIKHKHTHITIFTGLAVHLHFAVCMIATQSCGVAMYLCESNYSKTSE